MYKYISIFFFSLIFYSCNDKEKSFYKSGNLKAKHIILNGEKVDSSIYYSDNIKKQIIKITRYLNDSIQYDYYYNEFSNITREGEILNKEDRIGRWKFHKKIYDSIVEYKWINSASYVNQIWIISKSKDTIHNKGNFFKLYSKERKDTIKVNAILKMRLHLLESFYGSNSDIKVLLPANDKELNSDFSNFYQIKLNIINSLKNDKFSDADTPKDVPLNHMAQFHYTYAYSGSKKIRGALVEYKNENKQKVERILFFEKDIFVKD